MPRSKVDVPLVVNNVDIERDNRRHCIDRLELVEDVALQEELVRETQYANRLTSDGLPASRPLSEECGHLTATGDTVDDHERYLGLERVVVQAGVDSNFLLGENAEVDIGEREEVERLVDTRTLADGDGVDDVVTVVCQCREVLRDVLPDGVELLERVFFSAELCDVRQLFDIAGSCRGTSIEEAAVVRDERTLEVQDEVHKVDSLLRNALALGVRMGAIAPEPLPVAHCPRLEVISDRGVDVFDDEVVGKLREIDLVRESDGLEVDVLELISLARALPEQPGPPFNRLLPPVMWSARGVVTKGVQHLLPDRDRTVRLDIDNRLAVAEQANPEVQDVDREETANVPLPDRVEAALKDAVDALLREGDHLVESGVHEGVLNPLGPHHRMAVLPGEVVALTLLGLGPIFLILAAIALGRDGQAEDNVQVVPGDNIEVVNREEGDHVPDVLLGLLTGITLAKERVEAREPSGWRQSC